MNFFLSVIQMMVLVGCMITNVSAQMPFFQNYSLSKRNNPVSVNKIFQDRSGFVWFASNKGLYRFDGRNYRHFTLADSLPDINVTAIGQDSLGRIWTGHQSGALAFMEGDRFHTFTTQEGAAAEPVSDIEFDATGRLWFSTFNDGLYYFDPMQKRLFRLDDAEGLPDLFVYDLATDHSGNVWAGTDGGVAICTLRDGKVSIDVLNGRKGLPDNIVKKIIVAEEGTVYLGTEDSGVVSFDTRTRKFSLLGNVPWEYGSVTDLVRKNNQLWIGSTKDGVRVYDLTTGVLNTFEDEKRVAGISAMLLDAEGNIWCAGRSGILRTPGSAFHFISLSADERGLDVLAVAEDNAGNLWYSDVHGLHKRTGIQGRTVTTDILNNTPYRQFRVISLFPDAFGYMWAGLYGEGVLRISPAGKITHLDKQLRNGNVLSISGKKNHVWLATLGGCVKISIQGDDLSIENIGREQGLSSDFIYQVFEDSQSRVWFATDGKGIDMLDAKGFHHFQQGLPSSVVYGFTEDGNGKIWLNAQEGGVMCWTGSEFEPLPVTLRSENISSLSSTQDGNLLIAHDLGIDEYDVKNNSLWSFGDEAGLQDHIVNLNAAFIAKGKTYFGTTAGVVIYSPEQRRDYVPKVFIESLRVNGKNMSIHENMELAYDQNDLTIEFVGFWYHDPTAMRFSYKMDNFDPSFISTSDNSVTYSKLPPGEYSFSVNGIVNEQLTTHEASTFHLIIRPPFWRTTWFYILVVVTGAAGAYGIVKYREKKLVEDKAVLEQKVEERTREIQRQNEEIQAQNEEILAQAEEIKGINENLEMLVQQRTLELERKNKALEEYAFINAHKLRSPVASILGLINLLRNTTLDAEATIIHQHLAQAADELDKIVRSITQAIERGDQ